MSRSRLYNIWRGMKQRCHYPRHPKYFNYGGRGIVVCDAWRGCFKDFADWALSHGYAAGLTLDRKDVNGNYEPTNCRWATRSQQEKNKWAPRKRKQHDAEENINFDQEKAA